MADTGEGGGGLDQQRLASSLDGTCSGCVNVRPKSQLTRTDSVMKSKSQ